MISNKIDQCRICKSKNFRTILRLGDQPPANSLLNGRTDREELVPLAICRCDDCSAIQLTETVDPKYLFANYVWVTGTSKSAKDHSEIFCNKCLCKTGNQEKLFVLEIASNDGTFLQPFKNRGHKVLGVDPAQNIGKISNEGGIETHVAFFGLNVSKEIAQNYGYADIVFARNVISHVDDAYEVVAGMANSLKYDGVGAIEFHRADIILEELHYDSVYHEHIFYHSLHSMNILLENFELNIFDVSESPISGGSFVVYFSKQHRDKTLEYKNALAREERLNVNSLTEWEKFALRCEKHKEHLNKILVEESANGKKVIGYGASARSSTLLNFCGINNRHIEVIADNNKLKQNKFTPGSKIKITSPSKAFSIKPDTVLLLAWNLKNEILDSLKSVYNFQGDIIIPLPNKPVITSMQ